MRTIHSYILTYEKWLLASMMVLATFFSFVFFQNQSLRLDESQSLWQTSATPLKIFNLVAQDVHVPLYHLMLHAWQVFFGNDVSTVRLLSLVFFLLAIPSIYYLGKLCYDPPTALFSTIFLTISPFMNWYGNEARMYSLFVFIVIINQYFFISLFKRKTPRTWAGFAITAFFGMYTHYFFFLILFVDAIFYFFNPSIFEKGAFKKFLWTYIGLAVLFLPWISYVLYLGHISNTAPSLAKPTTVDVFNTFSQFLFGFQTDHLNTILVSLWPLTLLLAFFALRKNRKVAPETVYLILSFLLPNAIAFVVSFKEPIYLTRYLIFTMPSMYLLLSWLFSSYQPKIRAAAQTLVIGAMIVTLCIEALSANTPAKENYRGASDYLEQYASPSDVIVVSAPFTIYPMLYYYTGPSTLTTLPIWDMNSPYGIPPYSSQELQKDVATLTSDHTNIWLLLSYDQGYQSDIQNYFNTHYQELTSKVFSPDLTLYEYKIKY